MSSFQQCIPEPGVPHKNTLSQKYPNNLENKNNINPQISLTGLFKIMALWTEYKFSIFITMLLLYFLKCYFYHTSHKSFFFSIAIFTANKRKAMWMLRQFYLMENPIPASCIFFPKWSCIRPRHVDLITVDYFCSATELLSFSHKEPKHSYFNLT